MTLSKLRPLFTQSSRSLAPVLAALLAAAPLLSGCASKPTAALAGAHITELTLDHVGVTFDVRVDNPWLVALPLVSATGNLSSPQVGSGAPFLQLQAGTIGSVPAQGSLTIPLSGRLAYVSFLSSLPSIHPGDEVPYLARLKLTTGVPVTSQTVDLPEIRHEGKVPILSLPSIVLKSVSWPTFSLDRISGNITLGIRNTNKFAIGPGALTGKLLLKKQASTSGDQDLAGFTANLQNAIAGSGEGDLVVGVAFEPRNFFNLSSWTSLAQALTSPTNLRVTGNFSGSTEYAPITFSFDTK